MKVFKGNTESADAVFLGADFWKPGVAITGQVVRTFESENGPCYVFHLLKPQTIGNETTEEVCMGNLTGFRMALQSAGLDSLEVGDAIHLVCTGLKSTAKGSPRANFEIEVNRN